PAVLALAAVSVRVLPDDLPGLVPAAGTRPELGPLRAELCLVQSRNLVDGLLRESRDPVQEGLPVAPAVLDVRELVLPVTSQLGGRELVLLQHRDHLDALRGRLEVLADALDVLAADQRLDRLGARRRGAEAGVLNRLTQLLVVDQLAGGLHRGQERRLAVARRGSRHLVLVCRFDAADRLALLERRNLAAFGFLVLRLLLGVGLEAVDAAPAGLERDLAARAEALFLDERDHGRARVTRRRMEDGEEATRDGVEDAALVGREVVDVVVDVRRDDRVVVVDLCVVDDAGERQLVEREHVLGSGAVLLDRTQCLGGRLQLRDHVAGQEARRGSRIRDRLLPFVQRLPSLQRAARRESVTTVCVALQRREVVQERRALGLLFSFNRLDHTVLAENLRHDLFGALQRPEDPRTV